MNIEHAIYILQQQENALQAIQTYVKENKIIEKLQLRCSAENWVVENSRERNVNIVDTNYEVLGVSDDKIVVGYTWYGPYQATEHYTDYIPLCIIGNETQGIEEYFEGKLKEKQRLIDDRDGVTKRLEGIERETYLRLKLW